RAIRIIKHCLQGYTTLGLYKKMNSKPRAVAGWNSLTGQQQIYTVTFRNDRSEPLAADRSSRCGSCGWIFRWLACRRRGAGRDDRPPELCQRRYSRRAAAGYASVQEACAHRSLDRFGHRPWGWIGPFLRKNYR